MTESTKSQIEKVIFHLRQEPTRWEAIIEIKRISDPEAVPYFVDYLNDGDWVVRWCVAEKLGEMGALEAIRPLIRLFHDTDIHVRKNASKALIKIGKPAVPALVREFASYDTSVRTKTMQTLLEMGSDILKDLAALIQQENWIIENRIVDTIWRIGGPEAERILIKLIPKTLTQKAIIVLLGHSRSGTAVPALMGAFRHPKLRRAILHALAQIGDPAYAIILKGITTGQTAVKTASEELAIRLGKPMAIYLKKQLLVHPEIVEQIAPIVRKIVEKAKAAG